MNPNEIRKIYNKNLKLYEKLKDEVAYIIDSELKKEPIKIHSLCGRIKELKSFNDKSERNSFDNPFENINDIVGLRIICLFIDDLPKIKAILHRGFDIISEDNKIQSSQLDKFGYMSIHYICKIPDSCNGLRYNDIKSLKFEIQVRTILMDAWANISHYLDYKTENSIPSELKKNFYALSGLFYIADSQFQIFYNESKKSSCNAAENIKNNSDTELNIYTLRSYLKTKYPDRSRRLDSKGLSELIEELYQYNITSIEEIDNLLRRSKQAFDYYELNSPPNGDGKFSGIGVIRTSFKIMNKEYGDKYTVSPEILNNSRKYILNS